MYELSLTFERGYLSSPVRGLTKKPALQGPTENIEWREKGVAK